MEVIRLENSEEKNFSPKNKMELLFQFHGKLKELIDNEEIKWDKRYFTKFLRVCHNGRTYNLSGDTFEIFTDNSKFRLSLIPNNNHSIEIWWIQVYNKGNKLGTEIMNKILDVSDELGVGVKVIPVDIDNPDGKVRNLYRLRDWYRSFGFVNKNYNRTPELFYEPQTEQLKQVS
ncbi:hypothetical protein [uncultured Zobellia sp.]|uniref:hypothetical protein n=1 Tax=uncultured Zobellia sp. TaxID=255433 RepID=UPI002593F365|nr:hypothetical protein [uncultured Zobellia sp.]